MNIHRVLVVTAVIASVYGCYLPISGSVIDAETQQPIEGAVVLAEWTKTKGYGFTYTESYKVVEAVSDKEGKVKIEGCLCLFTNPPDVTVYKKGYVAWNNKFIFPKYEKRTDYMRQNDSDFKLYKYQDTYSRKDHISFIHGSINYGLTGSQKKSIEDAIRWEQLESVKDK